LFETSSTNVCSQSLSGYVDILSQDQAWHGAHALQQARSSLLTPAISVDKFVALVVA
jgi:hypothetical protein